MLANYNLGAAHMYTLAGSWMQRCAFVPVLAKYHFLKCFSIMPGHICLGSCACLAATLRATIFLYFQIEHQDHALSFCVVNWLR